MKKFLLVLLSVIGILVVVWLILAGLVAQGALQ